MYIRPQHDSTKLWICFVEFSCLLWVLPGNLAILHLFNLISIYSWAESIPFQLSSTKGHSHSFLFIYLPSQMFHSTAYFVYFVVAIDWIPSLDSLYSSTFPSRQHNVTVHILMSVNSSPKSLASEYCWLENRFLWYSISLTLCLWCFLDDSHS